MSYHHGDLRDALIRSAIALIADTGSAGLSLRKVAIHAGVSHAAPYHHFKDKEALLAAVSEHGFLELTERLTAITGSDPFERLDQLGHAYVRFALDEPDMYRFMFSPAVPDKSQHPELMQCAHGTFQTLVDTIAACVATGQTHSTETLALAVQVWGMTHGIASLISDDMVSMPVASSGGTLDLDAVLTRYMTAVTDSIRA